MHCEQGVLQDILGLIEGLSRSRQAPTCHGPQDRCESFKQLAIGAAVAYKSRGSPQNQDVCDKNGKARR